MLKSAFIFSAVVMNLTAHAQVVDQDHLTPVNCPAGTEFESWYLAPTEEEIQIKQVSQLIPGTTAVQPPDYRTMTVGFRLDGCVSSEDQFKLERVLLGKFAVYEITERNSRLEVSGLSEARLGDLSKLKIRARNDSVNFVIRGGDGFVAMAYLNDEDKPALGLVDVLVGKLELGDPFPKNEGPCERGAIPSTGSTDFGSARLDYEICMYGGTSGTTPFKIRKVSLTDTDKGRPEAYRGKPLSFEPSEIFEFSEVAVPPVPRHFLYRSQHHNGCESFVISVPELKAVYSITSSDAAGCGEPIPGAEKQTARTKKSGGSIVRIDYDGKKGKPFQIQARHPLGLK